MSPPQYPDELKAYFGLGLPEEPIDVFQNILVYLQTKEDKILDVSLEVLGKAVELASLLGVKVEAVAFGLSDNLAGDLIYYGANTVYLMPPTAYNTREYTQALFSLIQNKKPEIILFGQTYQSLDFAPRLAQRLKTALLTNCLQLDIDTDNRCLIGTSLIYKGLLLQEMKIPQVKPQMAMVLEKKFNLPSLDKNRIGEVIKI